MQIRNSLLSFAAFAALSLLGAPGALAQNAELHATLVGGNETPNPGSATGYGTAAIAFRGPNLTQVCVSLVVTGIPTPTAAHIHKGFGPTAGPIVVTLATPAGGNPGFSGACANISATLSAQIRKDPSGFYINGHTGGAFATGAIRGQLF